MNRLCLVVSIIALSTVACGPPKPVTQPAPPPPPQCHDFARSSGTPLTVDMNGQEQALLQTKLEQEGVVLVHYDCNGLRVLDRCSAAGGYGYAGVAPQLEQVRIFNDQDVVINLGSGLSFLATVGGGFSQFKTLDLVVMTVGSIATPINALSKRQIKGPDCMHATHYVRRAYKGGFAMTQGQATQTNAAVSLFQVGFQTSATQLQSIQRASGSMATCQAQAPGAKTAPTGCGAVVRLGLVPLDEQLVTAQRARDSLRVTPWLRSCPPGHVFSAGACTVWTDQLPSYLCSGQNRRECEDQCGRGDLPSCGRLAWMLVDELANVGPQGRDALVNQISALMPKLEQACDAWEGEACGFLVSHVHSVLTSKSMVQGPEAQDPQDAMMAARLAMQAERGCLAGNAESCEILAEVLGPSAPFELYGVTTDTQRLAQVMERACNGGNGTACGTMSLMAFDPEEMGEVQVADPFSYAERACLAGSDIGCLVAGVFHIGSGKACEAVAGKGARQLCEGEEHKNLDRAASAFKRACDLSEEGRYCKTVELMPLIRECDEGSKRACKKLKKQAR